ncbi:hypothetical protein DL546_000065 [Coniochaeta pulveracea]|uniref:Uncharacterized protein n=1 Tax=Coniochaeta pulveracea TaxID=177199 RepID=A0A420XVM7_9PEZI|nr:hypothetical protein DL546_000065 [Coniochaeta pulveracea]
MSTAGPSRQSKGKGKAVSRPSARRSSQADITMPDIPASDQPSPAVALTLPATVPEPAPETPTASKKDKAAPKVPLGMQGDWEDIKMIFSWARGFYKADKEGFYLYHREVRQLVGNAVVNLTRNFVEAVGAYSSAWKISESSGKLEKQGSELFYEYQRHCNTRMTLAGTDGKLCLLPGEAGYPSLRVGEDHLVMDLSDIRDLMIDLYGAQDYRMPIIKECPTHHKQPAMYRPQQ